MAVTRVSPGYPDTISPVTEGGKHKLGTYPGRAGNPDVIARVYWGGVMMLVQSLDS